MSTSLVVIGAVLVFMAMLTWGLLPYLTSALDALSGVAA